MVHQYPRMMVFEVAMTSGILLALSAHIASALIGVGLYGSLDQVMNENGTAMRAALGWWMVGGAGFLGSFIAGSTMQPDEVDTRTRRRLRWLICILFFILVAVVPYIDAAAPAGDLQSGFAVALAAFGLGVVTAFCGSWFALRR